jgi:predicted N-acyltransferase
VNLLTRRAYNLSRKALKEEMKMNQSNGFKIEEYKGYECSIQLFCGFYEVFKKFLSKNDLKFRFIMSKNLVA